MTEAEARQLKPGDRVLVEMEVFMDPHNSDIDKNSHVWLIGGLAKPEQIREKIAPPRRRFKEGDLVKFRGALAIIEVNRDELEDNLVFAGGFTKPFLFAELILVCAVEDRADRSAADGSGVTRKGGEV